MLCFLPHLTFCCLPTHSPAPLNAHVYVCVWVCMCVYVYISYVCYGRSEQHCAVGFGSRRGRPAISLLVNLVKETTYRSLLLGFEAGGTRVVLSVCYIYIYIYYALIFIFINWARCCDHIPLVFTHTHTHNLCYLLMYSCTLTDIILFTF